MKRTITPLFCFLLTISWHHENTLAWAKTSDSPDYSNDKKAVMKVINRLFDGMRKGDSAMVSSVFDKNARMASIGIKNDTPHFREGSLKRFLDAVGTPHEKVWDERIWAPIVQIDDNMATVWVNYAFYLGDQFSHCGVNAFQLFKDVSGWKIVNLTDTKRKDNCKEP